MSIDITGANTYFGESVHIQNATWTKIPQARRIAALAHAKRLIMSFLGDTSLDETVTTDADFPRHDAAVYEQALWMLVQIDEEAENRSYAIRNNAGGAFALNLRAARSTGGQFAPEALRFLVQYPRVIRMVRG